MGESFNSGNEKKVCWLSDGEKTSAVEKIDPNDAFSSVREVWNQEVIMSGASVSPSCIYFELSELAE